MRLRMLGLTLAVLGGGAVIAYGVSCVSNDSGNTDCAAYCSDVAAACQGIAAQYPTTDNNLTCLTVCSAMEAGTPGVGGGNTVACREMGVSNAKDDTPANVYGDCVNGGPAAAGCPVDPCNAFCNLDLALCPTQFTGYADVASCVAACQTWDDVANKTGFSGPLIGSTGNTLQCRTYHLELSQSGHNGDLATHCPHTSAVSARCFDSDGGTDAGVDGASDAPAD